MSGGSEHKPSFVDDAVLGSGLFGWTFDHPSADDTALPMSPPPLHRSGGMRPPPLSAPGYSPHGQHHGAVPGRHRSQPSHPQSRPAGRHMPPPIPHGQHQTMSTLPPPPVRSLPPPSQYASSSTDTGSNKPRAGSSSSTMPTVGPTASSTCQFCGKTYSRPDYLRTHIAGKHSGQKIWSCSVCGKEYKWRSSLSHHLKTAHNDSGHSGGSSSAPRRSFDVTRGGNAGENSSGHYYGTQNPGHHSGGHQSSGHHPSAHHSSGHHSSGHHSSGHHSSGHGHHSGSHHPSGHQSTGQYGSGSHSAMPYSRSRDSGK